MGWGSLKLRSRGSEHNSTAPTTKGFKKINNPKKKIGSELVGGWVEGRMGGWMGKESRGTTPQ